MFGLFKDRLDGEINKLCETYEQKLAQQAKQIDALIKEREDAKKGDVATSTFSADFARMNAFAIERNVSGTTREVCTIIGYTLKEPVVFTDGNVSEKDVVREWYLYCNQEQHEKLVKEFNEYRNTYVKADQ